MLCVKKLSEKVSSDAVVFQSTHDFSLQKWLEVLHERLGSTKLEKSTEEETIRGKEEEKRKKGDEGGKEVQ